MNRLGINNYSTYYNYLNTNQKELDAFLEGLTINYSYFFRNGDVFTKFFDIITSCLKESGDVYIPELSLYKKIKNNQKLRIWSCACANGEEPYSIAMLLNNLKQDNENLPNYEIIASDIDRKALSVAKMGIYKKDSLEEINKYYQNEYFTENSHDNISRFILSEEIRNQVNFIEEDITKGHSGTGKYDIIFCRNLLIYINREFRKNLLKILHKRLKTGGLLILGKTESLNRTNSNFRWVDIKNRIFIKK